MKYRPLRIAFIGRYTEGQTGIVRAIYMGLQELGHQVLEINVAQRREVLSPGPRMAGGHGPNVVSLRHLLDDFQQFRPEVVLLCAGGLTFSEEDTAVLRKYTTVIGMTLSDPDVFPTVSTYADRFTYHTTNSEEAFTRYRDLGHRNIILMPFGIDSRFFVPQPVDPRFKCDIAVIGHAHAGRIPIAERLAANFDVMFHGRNWPFRTTGVVRGEDWFKAAYSTKFLVNFPLTRAGHTNVKVGVFEATATGRLLFTEYFEEMENYFAYDKEIVGFRDPEELVAKLRYYLNHPAEAERIAKAGQLRCAYDHTWRKRLMDLFQGLEIPAVPRNWKELRSARARRKRKSSRR